MKNYKETLIIDIENYLYGDLTMSELLQNNGFVPTKQVIVREQLEALQKLHKANTVDDYMISQVAEELIHL